MRLKLSFKKTVDLGIVMLALLFIQKASASKYDYYVQNADGTYTAYYELLGSMTLMDGDWKVEVGFPVHNNTAVTYSSTAAFMLANNLTRMAMQADYFISRNPNVISCVSWPWILGWHFEVIDGFSVIRPTKKLFGHHKVPMEFPFCPRQVRCDKTRYEFSYMDADFHDMESLTGLTIPAEMHLSHYGTSNFHGCRSFKTLECPADFFGSITSLFDATNQTLEVLKFHPTDTGWCSGVSGLTSLKKLDAPVAGIEDSACAGCVHLTSVNLGSTMRTIKANAFMDCQDLKHITLPQSLNYVGDAAFYNSGLEEIVIPDGVRYLGRDFAATPTIKSITVGVGVTNEVSVYHSAKLEKVVVKDCNACFSLTRRYWGSPLNRLEIGAREVSCISAGRELFFSDNVESISSDRYIGDTDLRTIVFGTGLTNIYGRIQGYETLRTLIFNGDAPLKYNDDLLASTPTNIIVYVRRGTCGWNGSGSTDLPERWPKGVDVVLSRKIRYLGDDDDDDTFHIVDVRSDYCRGEYGHEGGQRATFLTGIALPIEFHVECDMGKSCKTLHHFEYGFNNTVLSTFKFDPGSLSAGSKFTVVGVATDGTRTKPFRVNFDVANPKGTLKFHVSDRSSDSTGLSEGRVTYRSVNFSSLAFLDGLNDVRTKLEDTEIELEILPSISLDATIDSSTGCFTFDFGGGVARKTKPFAGWKGSTSPVKVNVAKMAGADVSCELTYAPREIWDPRRKSWENYSNSAGVRVSGEGGLTFGIPQTLEIVYLQAKLCANAELYGTWDDDEGFTFAADFDPLFALKGVVGAGVDGFGPQGEVYGGFYASLRGPEKPNWVKFGFRGGVALRMQVVGMETWSWNILDWTHQIYPSTKSANALMLSTKASADQLSMTPRADVAEWKCADRIGTIDVSGGGGEQIIYATDYQYPQPALAAASGTNCVLFVKDAKDRDDVNRGILMCACNASGGYEINSVWDDGTPDCRPSVVIGSTGVVFATWMNASRAFGTADSALDQISGSEIAVGIRPVSEREWTCTNITSDAGFDKNPKVCAGTDGGACVVWVKNAHSKVFGSAEYPDNVMVSRICDGNWTEPLSVATQGRVDAVDVMCGSNGIYYATFAEIGDDGVCNVCIYNEDSGSLTRFSTTSFEGVQPKLFMRPDGDLAVMWYGNGHLKSASVSGGSSNQENVSWSVEKGEFALASDRKGHLAMIWSDGTSSGLSDMDPVASYYDAKLSKWVSPTPLACNAERNENFVRVAFDNDKIVCAYESVTQGDEEDELSGIADIRVLERRLGPDAAVLSNGIDFTDDSIFTQGSNVTVVARIVNFGNAAVEEADVHFFVGSSEDSLSLLSPIGHKISIPVGGFADVSETFVFGSVSNDFVVKVSVDANTNVCGDVATANNSACRHSIASPILSNPKIESIGKLIRKISVAVGNYGFKDIPAGSQVTFRIGGPDGKIVGTDVLGSISACNDASVRASLLLDMSSLDCTNDSEKIYMQYSPPSGTSLTRNKSWNEVVLVGVPHWIRFDAAGGISEDGDWYESGMCYASLPIPKKEGATFVGWFTEPHGAGEQIDRETIVVSESKVLYAHWDQDAKPVAVTFDLDGKGTRCGGGELEQDVVIGTYVDAPAIDANEGWLFVGWIPSTNIPITASTVFVAQYERSMLDIVVGDGRGNLLTNRVEYGTTYDFHAPATYYETNSVGIRRVQHVCRGSSATDPVVTNAFSLLVTNNVQIVWDIWQTNNWLGLEIFLDGNFQHGIYNWIDSGTRLQISWQANQCYIGEMIGDIAGCATNSTSLVIPMDIPRTITLRLKTKGGEDPLPEIDDPTPEQIESVLENADDPKLAVNITNEADYTHFRAWAHTVKPYGGNTAAGVDTVMSAPNAWLSFALGSETLIKDAPTNGQMRVEKFEPTSTAGAFDFTVSIDDISVGSEATKENLKKVFGLEGGATLDALSSTNIDISFGTPENGKVKFTAGPNAKNVDAKTFFMKVKMNP